ncbi:MULTISPECIES: CDP-alcohol phosphatidyltransferase family protein [unclassified Bradyrhizobium]|uniref:CDP-alcohol phosphatidyltransferase family protein n=1 Tax=unclassified Bradyrhizobium TaxID=2631580 RepID=UPI0024787294|nr:MULTISPECIES: CDP-alcohol phosphatidyltransferase family protein [unclassified Bradyrhizobium]WGR73032.1 CDP-alcohol phosphatidyltransferase family protein [Bradyrhizobium sp. ISRA426]WGR77869.1 CDP-alcohol phosphatidyltransferase family protein [Bradyrhizobium sp. ISRA430]WGR88272.1 CDP-alcohol phosphatidyltransferase family protein [Bradyrhizobium sp. ISRA432]
MPIAPGQKEEHRGSMIAYLSDRANAVTALGLFCSGAATGLVAKGRYEAGVALGLWAIIADDVDGEIARRTKNRTMATKAVGKALDAFSDLIFGSVIPSIVVASFMESPASPIFTALLLLIGALRLAYFDHFGLDDRGYSTGLPLSYALPVLAAILLIDHTIAPLELGVVLPAFFVPLSLLHIAPFKIKASGSLVHVITIGVAATASAGLLMTSRAGQ